MTGTALSLAGMIAVTQIQIPDVEGMNAVIAVDQFVVINNTRSELTCAKNGGSGWSRWFTIAPGAEWNGDDFDIGASAQFQCRPPVRRLSYKIVAGKRYSLVRGAGDEVELIEVTASSRSH